MLCYRVGGGAAAYLDQKFVSQETLPPIPHTHGYVAGGGQYKVRATHQLAFVHMMLRIYASERRYIQHLHARNQNSGLW